MDKQNEVLYLVIANNEQKALRLMDALTFSHMHDLSRVSRAERTIYFKDGKIFKFSSEADRNLTVGRRNWNIYSSRAFEEEFLKSENE